MLTDGGCTGTPPASTTHATATLAGMPNPSAATPAPPRAGLYPGSPDDIRRHARSLLEAIRAGSVDAEGFAANALLAVRELGLEVPPFVEPMLAGALANAYIQPA